MKIKLYSLYCLLCFLWGTTWFAIKISLNEGMPPFFGAGIRFLFAGIILWGIFFAKRETLPRTRKAINLYFQFSILNFSVAYAITYWAAQFVYSNVSSIVWAGFPLTVAILSHFLLPSEKLDRKKIFSIFFGTIGAVLVLSQGKNFGGENVILGISALFIAVLIASWPNVTLKKYVNEVNSIQLNAVSHTIGGLVLILLSCIFEQNQPMIWTVNNLLALAYLSIFGSVICWLIYFWLFSYLSITQISYVAFFPPIIAIIIGWFFLGEVLTTIAILGAILVIGGALVINIPNTRTKINS